MGNDGGSIPKRRELVKEAAKDPSTTQTKEVQNEQQEHCWKYCALSNRPLSVPVVSDWMGKLYNKDAVLESLIASSGDGSRGINEDLQFESLKDVVEVKFQAEEEDGGAGKRPLSPRWMCPITNKTLGPGVKAVYLVPCGHAFSDSAIKEISGDVCLECDATYSLDDIITILPVSNTEKDRLKQRALRLKEQGLGHSLKKTTGAGKKRKKNGAESGIATAEAIDDNVKSSSDVQCGPAERNTTSGIRNVGTASLTARVLAEEQERKKRRRTGENENLKGLFSSRDGNPKMHADFMTRGFSIPAGAKR